MLSLSQSSNPQPLHHPWRNLITVGRAYDLLRADLLKHLSWLQDEIGYRYCRYHALFHDDMGVVKRLPSGDLVYHWHHVDKVHDALLARGLKPFVELNSMPAALASGKETMFYYRMNITPPADWDEWGALVEAFARHSIERYGRDEVCSWYFEVWNEPNLGGFWTGSQQDYFKLYATAAAALKRVDAGLRVGGPATSKASWIADFITFCHENSVPVDFVSTHLYPQDEQVEFPDRVGSPHAVGEYFTETVRSVQQVVTDSAMPELQIHWSEWNSQTARNAQSITWGENVHVDSAFAAPFIARTCAGIDDCCQSFGWWVASDIFEEGGIPSTPLSCTYGLLTIHGLPKASANAFRLFRRLAGERMDITFSESAHTGRGSVATQADGHIHLLMWNHAHAELPPPPAWQETLQFPWPDSEPPQVLAARVGPKGGSVYEAWLELGKPVNLNPSQFEFLKSRAEPVWSILTARMEAGNAIIDLSLEPHELLYLDISPQPTGTDRDLRLTSSEWDDWDKKMGALSS